MLKLPAFNKYPKRLHVGDDVYRVIFTNRMDGDALGITDSEALTIKIRPDMSKRQTMEVFIHEILHAMEFSYNIKIKHKSVYKYSTAILNLLMDNF